MKELRLSFSMRYPYWYDRIWNLVRKIKAYRMRFGESRKTTVASVPPGLPVRTSGSSSSPIILMAIHWFAPSGTEYYALECARLAREEGFEIIWVVDFPSVDEQWRQEFIGLSSHAVLLWQETSPLLAITERVNAIGGEVVGIHIHHSPFFYENLAMLKASFPKASVVDTTHIIELTGEGFPKRSLEAGNAIEVRNVISQGLSDYFTTRGIAASSLYRSAIVPKQVIRRRNASHGTFSIGIIGRLSQQKRPYLLPALFERLDNILASRRFSGGVSFFIYGYGPYAKHLKKSFGFEHITVSLKEHCYDRNEIYRGLDCVLQISENEGVSIVSYEAASYGIPFLATDVGQQREMVHPEFLLPARPRQAVRKAAEVIAMLAMTPENYMHVTEWQYDRLDILRREFGYQERMRQLYRSLFC